MKYLDSVIIVPLVVPVHGYGTYSEEVPVPNEAELVLLVLDN